MFSRLLHIGHSIIFAELKHVLLFFQQKPSFRARYVSQFQSSVTMGPVQGPTRCFVFKNEFKSISTEKDRNLFFYDNE